MAEVTIMQVVPRLDTGGTEQSAVEIAEAIIRAGANALVATEGGRLAADVRSAGGEVIKLPMASKNPLTILANARALAALVSERDISLLHARSRAPAWSALLAARWTGRPFVTTYHGTYGKPGPVKAVYNSVMGRGDRVIANSCYTANLIASRHEGAQPRIRTILRGLDSAIFDPFVVPPGSVTRLRESWHVPPGTKIVLHAARLAGSKGQRQAIEAVRCLNDEGSFEGAILILAGDGTNQTYRIELADLIARYGLGDKVRLVGHCSDMPVAFLASNTALIPSMVGEAFGRTSIEAQAMGCPVIVSDAGGLPETIVDAASDPNGFTGWMIKPGNTAALAERIKQSLNLQSVERLAIGARARAWVTTKFVLGQMQAKTLAVYDELLGTRLAANFSCPPRYAAAPTTEISVSDRHEQPSSWG
ncbi:glycosyltransferase family 4 protein [Methyloceanibacter superfactus]|uniref:glycosyltransferase family 4 protein n=1 Tax=Methyloceanibacter superfactus TaxID=1774969 RepID=UPI0008496ECD|nr:glycosyltransferase family 4 protein [Methyloceanibacter superfactus]